MPLWLNEADVRAVLPMADLIQRMAAALTAFSTGGVRQPVREVIEPGAGGNFYAAMPAYLDAGPAMGAKLVTVYHANGLLGLPTHQAVIVLLDPSNGSLLAVMDGRFITEVRTAAVTAVALRTLARKDSRVLAIVGSGVQAGSHLQAFELIQPFDEIRCWSPNHLQRFVDEHPGVQAASSAEAAVRGADVVLAVTSSTIPVIGNDWVKPGALVVGIGACRPYLRELDPKLVARSRLIVDSRAAALKESGDVLMAMDEGHFGADHIAAELGEVLAGRVPGRQSLEQTIVFKPLGQAVEDVSAAQLAYTRAVSMGLGVQLG